MLNNRPRFPKKPLPKIKEDPRSLEELLDEEVIRKLCSKKRLNKKDELLIQSIVQKIGEKYYEQPKDSG